MVDRRMPAVSRARRRTSLTPTQLLALVVAALVAVSLCVIPLGRDYRARAYTPDTIEKSTGPGAEAEHSAEVTHTKVGKGAGAHDPHPGESFYYEYTFNLGRLPQEPGVEAQTVVHFNADYQAPFTDPQNFTFAGTPKERIDLGPIKCESNHQCSLTVDTSHVNRGKSVFLKFKFEAKVNENADPGSVIMGSGSIHTEYRPNITVKPGHPKYFEPDGVNLCEGTFHFEWQLTAGAWLADIKFADGLGKGQLDINKQPLSETDPRSYIRVLKPSSRAGRWDNITDEVLRNMKYNPDDPTRPYNGDQDPIVRLHPNAKWLQSANWPIDVNTYTGKTWLPAGTKVTVAKHGRHLACLAGTATDWQTNRPFEASLSIARPVTDASASDQTVFTLPGERPKLLPCQEKVWFADENYDGTGKHDSTSLYFGYLDGVGKSSVVAENAVAHGFDGKDGKRGAPVEVGSIAISEKMPQRVYYIAYSVGGLKPTGLVYHDLETGKYVAVDAPGEFGASDVPTWGEVNNRITIGFDNRGYIWGLQGPDNELSATAEIYRINVFSDKPQWQHMATLKEGAGKYTPRDLVFDKEGNMLALTMGGVKFIGAIWKPNGVLQRLPADELRARETTGKPSNISAAWIGGTALSADFKGKLGKGTQWNGLAWGPDGGLYAVQTFRKLYKLDYRPGEPWRNDLEEPQPIKVTRDGKPVNWFYEVDLGSCNYGEPVVAPPDAPKFQVQKSVVDPVTGTTVQPGKNSPHPTVVSEAGTATIDYYVTLTNSGTKAGAAPAVTDRLQLPQGFVAQRVTVTRTDNNSPAQQVRPNGQGTFTMPRNGGAMKPGELRMWKVSIDATAANPGAVNWTQASVCGEDARGAYGGGFFNKVSIPSDADGIENNHACIPTTPRGNARITLIKDIVDKAGHQLPARAADSQYFTLSAKQLGTERVAAIEGTSPSSGQPAVDHQGIAPGRFQLDERSNNEAKTQDYHFGTWLCAKAAGGVLDLGPANTITVANGDDVTCRVSNSPDQQRVHVLKRAADPASGANPHIGKPATKGNDGVYHFKYVIDVVNATDAAVDAGKVVEAFQVPAGMRWAQGVDAKVITPKREDVTIDMDNRRAIAQGCDFVDYGSTLQQWCQRPASLGNLTLADGITGIPAHSKVSFTVDIPLQPDDSSAGPTSAYDANAAKLEKCEPGSSPSGQNYAQPGFGIPNRVTLAGEDETYSDIARQDNLACIPVNVPLAPPPPLPLTGGNSALAFYLFGLPALGLGLVGAVALRLRKVGTIG